MMIKWNANRTEGKELMGNTTKKTLERVKKRVWNKYFFLVIECCCCLFFSFPRFLFGWRWLALTMALIFLALSFVFCLACRRSSSISMRFDVGFSVSERAREKMEKLPTCLSSKRLQYIRKSMDIWSLDIYGRFSPSLFSILIIFQCAFEQTPFVHVIM